MWNNVIKLEKQDKIYLQHENAFFAINRNIGNQDSLDPIVSEPQISYSKQIPNTSAQLAVDHDTNTSKNKLVISFTNVENQDDQYSDQELKMKSFLDYISRQVKSITIYDYNIGVYSLQSSCICWSCCINRILNSCLRSCNFCFSRCCFRALKCNIVTTGFGKNIEDKFNNFDEIYNVLEQISGENIVTRTHTLGMKTFDSFTLKFVNTLCQQNSARLVLHSSLSNLGIGKIYTKIAEIKFNYNTTKPIMSNNAHEKPSIRYTGKIPENINVTRWDYKYIIDQEITHVWTNPIDQRYGSYFLENYIA